jgi:hypothetical protein
MASLLEQFTNIEKKYGIPQGYLARTRAIESANGTNLRSSTGAQGPFQFTRRTSIAMGLPLDQRNNEVLSAEAAAKYAQQNQSLLSKTLGRQPTAAELYYAHQQGGPGASRILSNLNQPAGRMTDPSNIVYNGGRPGMTGASHFGMFEKKFNNARPGNLGEPFMSQGTAVASNTPTQNPVQGPTPGGATLDTTQAPAPAQAPAQQTAPEPPKPAIRPGGGLLGLAMQNEPLSRQDIASLVGGPEMAAAKAGMNFMSQADSAPKSAPAALPPMPQLPAEMMQTGNMDVMPMLASIGRRRRGIPTMMG